MSVRLMLALVRKADSQKAKMVHSTVPSARAEAVLLILNGCSMAMKKYPMMKIATNATTMILCF